ncbi:CheR family methyltransferase [Treponema sp.]|uniref:CheR family methyltransferase n=1 Tax=Treponema sp. TaxID=166 RepID=UPI00389065F3
MMNEKVVLTKDELDIFMEILTARTGIVPRASHLDGIKSYIESRIAEKHLTVQEYKNDLISDEVFFTELVNESTVNETYFFREEKQFALLRDRIFPMWRALKGNSELKIWSAACSSGEEAYSLAILAKSCSLNVTVTASDINSNVLSRCSKGLYPASSLRQVDGVSFHSLLESFRQEDGKIAVPQELRSLVKIQKINLSEIDSPSYGKILPQNQDIVFLRNVFIYFSPELRSRILRTIADKCLGEGGVIFVSMSEIAQIDSVILPPSLEKVVDGNIFYLHKKTGGKDNG